LTVAPGLPPYSSPVQLPDSILHLSNTSIQF